MWMIHRATLIAPRWAMPLVHAHSVTRVTDWKGGIRAFGRKILLVFALAILLPSGLRSQDGSAGAVSGTVKDPQAGVTQDARRVVVNMHAGVTAQGLKKDQARMFSAMLLPSGPPNNDHHLEGISANDLNLSTRSNVPLSNPDTLAEFKTETTLFHAFQGRTGDRDIQVDLKSITDEYHGDFYEFFRGRSLNANDSFLKPAPSGALNTFAGDDVYSRTIKKHASWTGRESGRYQLNRFCDFGALGNVTFGNAYLGLSGGAIGIPGLGGSQNFTLGRITTTQAVTAFEHIKRRLARALAPRG